MKSLTQLEQHILLAIFHLKDNAYLITIREFLKKNTGKNHAIATIYVPLERLTKQGWLDTVVGGPSPKVGGRAIKYYQLTKEGFHRLEEMKKINDRFWMGFPKGAHHEK
jgi:DNA-binding PadR family transcriptional regulator